jgi:deazaflavin-dependent oxidoreductase (nitroreductase family)
VSIISQVQGVFLKGHQVIYERSGGWVGHRLMMVPTLLLRTVGARTGATRTSALVYVKDGDAWVVVASNGGQDRPPGWYFNVKADPKVIVQVGRRRIPALATVIEGDDPDHGRLFDLADTKNHGRYKAYQRQTDRPIAVVRLAPMT